MSAQLFFLNDAGPAREVDRILNDFEQWWRLYPRKVGKLKAREKYIEAIEGGATPDELIEGVQRFRKELRDNPPDDVCFVCHPTTWLHQGRWMDRPGLDLDETEEEAEARARQESQGFERELQRLDSEIKRQGFTLSHQTLRRNELLAIIGGRE